MAAVDLGIYREVLLRLPAESLLRFRSVCKQWRAVIDDPCFGQAHIDNQHSSNSIIIRNWVGPPFYPLHYFNSDDLEFRNAQQTIPAIPLPLSRGGLSLLHSLPVSACNGLMILVTKHETTGKVGLEIWNPLTAERLKLPDPNVKDFEVLGMGLGYHRAADDYKVVVIDYYGKSSRRTHVYSLKSDSWRIVGDCPYDFGSPDVRHGVFLNGSLHWVSCDGIIIAFDFATENYGQLALPVLQTTPKSMQIDAMGGCLFLSYIGEEGIKEWEKKTYIDAWVMNEYGADDSWVKLFSLKESYLSLGIKNTRFVAYMKSKNLVLMQYWNMLIWFDIGSDSIKSVEVHGFCSNTKIAAQICVGSLFRVRDNCGRVASKIRTRKREAIKMSDTKLTFCVGNYGLITLMKSPALHDKCFSIDSKWFTYSCPGDEIQTASSDQSSESFIHLDICREIFLHLPAKSLVRLRAACKAYRAIIDEPCFVKAHTNHQPLASTILIKNSSGPPFYPLYSFDLDAINCTYELERIPSTPLGFTHSGLSYRSASVCNNLILFAKEKWELWLWNPLTNECLQLPRGEFNSDVTTFGLGYDYATDDYKVVVVDHCPCRELQDHLYRTHVYNLRSDSWRMIGNFPVNDDWFCPIGPGVSLCGALHWTSYGLNKIIVLDLRTEKYSKLQYPTLRRRSSIVDVVRFVEVLGGCLVLIDYVRAYNYQNQTDMWVMKEYGAEDSWINVISIDYDHIASRDLRPVAYMKGECQILLQDSKGLFLFDVENDNLQKLNIHGLRSSYALAFSGSIFRLHDNCGVSGSGSIRTERTRISKRQTKISDTDLYLCVSDGPRWLDHDSDECCRGLVSNLWYLSSSDEDGNGDD